MQITTFNPTPSRFPLGQVVATAGASDTFTPLEMGRMVRRHAQGDWGEVSRGDVRQNEVAIKRGERLMSAYTFRDQQAWIITEADRSATTILLPDEY